MRTQLSLPFAALLTLGIAVAQEAGGKPAAAPVLRILVQPSTAEGVRQNATVEVVERLTTGLARHQLLVVDGRHALQAHDHTQKVFQQFVGGDQPAPAAGEGAVGIAVDADLVITAGIFVEQEVEQQGRFVVRDRLRLRIVGAEDSAILFNDGFDARGQAFEGFGDAHKKAIESLCNPDDKASVVGKVAELVKAAAAAEAEKGTAYRVALHSDREDAELVARLGQALGEAAVAGSSQQTGSGRTGGSGTGGSGTGGSGEGVREFAEFALRFRGSTAELQSRVAGAAEGLPAPEGMVRSVSFLGSRRRLDLVVRTRKIEKSLAAEVESLVNGAVQDLVARNEQGLEGKKVAVLDTVVPSQSKSPALSNGIADWLRGAFQSSAKKGAEVLPDDAEQQKALEVIGKDAKLHREQGAVDPATIAFLQRSGAGVAVLSTLREVLNRWQLVVSMIDLNTGATARHVSVVPEAFHADLARELGGK